MSDNQKETAEFMLKAMELMKYDALSLGVSDLQFGLEFLERSREGGAFSYIASNLLYRGDKLSWASEYVIKETGGLKLAILGIIDPDRLAETLDPEEAEALQAIPPEEALKRLLPEVKPKSDLVILLSQLDGIKQFALLEAVKGIDVSISSGGKGGCASKKPPGAKQPKPPEGSVFLSMGPGGKDLGVLKVSLDDQRVPRVSGGKKVPLGSSFPGNEEMAKLVETHKNRQTIKMMEGLQLTPQEFMEYYRKEQNEQRKGDRQ